MVPPPLSTHEETPRPVDAVPVLTSWVRGTLVGVVAGLVTVFAIAAWLNPYDGEGQPRAMETHRQMGLPPCTFYKLSGMPCPSCGMTTSFALLVRGDVLNSLRANAVGTILAAVCLAIIPWGLASIVVNRPLFIVSMERALLSIVIGFLTLMLIRWLLVIGLMWWNGFLP